MSCDCTQFFRLIWKINPRHLLFLFICIPLVFTLSSRLIKTSGKRPFLNYTFAKRAIPSWQEEMCINRTHVDKVKTTFLPMLFRDITPNKEDYNIFLMDAACNPFLLHRHLCSVESYTHRNPTAKVWLLVTSSGVDDSDGLVSGLTKEYTNLHVVGADLDRMFNGTPLDSIFRTRRWLYNTPWPANNLSNLLRNVLLWRWGGLYSDTDCICVKNVTHLRNVIAYDEIGRVVNNAIMNFDAGHPFAYEMMKYLEMNFKPATWHVNSPGTATAVAKKLCRNKNLNKVLETKCEYVTLLPLKNLQLFRWQDWEKYFIREQGDTVLKENESIYVMHMYNKKSKRTPIEMNSNSIFEVMAKNFCPLTYDSAKRRASFF